MTTPPIETAGVILEPTQLERKELLDTIDAAIAAIENGEASPDQVLAAIDFTQRLKEIHAQLKDRLEVAAIAFIKKHGDIQDGTRRFYVGVAKTTKCTDLRGTIEAVLLASGGDFDAFAGCLSSNAFKPGACKDILGEAFGKLFKTSDEDEMREGKPAKQKLQKVDTRFIK